MSSPKKFPSVPALAKEFIRVMRSYLTKKQMDEVVKRNLDEPKGSRVCHTHDFCDANMAMDEAGKNLGVKFVPNLDDDRYAKLWSDAWELAVRVDFDTKLVDEFYEPEISDNELGRIVEQGISDIYRTIQKKLGVKAGDVAGLFHSGSKIDEQAFDHFKKYIAFEKAHG